MLKKTNILKILKVLISFTIIFVLYRQFDSKFADYNIAQNLPLLKKNYFYLSLLFMLMFIQWFVEAQKWRFLLYKVQYLKLGQSIKAIFSGLSVSFLTPNRTGEFLGRIIFISKGNRIKASIITFIGNKIFSLIGKIFFSLPITDILYTFVLGKTKKVNNLNLLSKDFCFCVELPIKAYKNNLNLTSSPANERKRIAGTKKVNAFRDGFKILISMIKLKFS